MRLFGLRRAQLVQGPLDAFGEVAMAEPRPGRQQQADRHARDRRMHARPEDADPHHGAEQHIGDRRHPAQPQQSDDAQIGRGRHPQEHRLHRRGIGEGDHQQPEHIVDRREGQQHRAHGRRQSRREHRDDRQAERGIHRRHHAPAMRGRRTPVERQIDRHRHHQPADRARHRKQRGLARRERSLDEFALHLRPDDQEEQRHQQVVDPFRRRPCECPGAIA